MPKITLDTLANLANENTAVQTINSNFAIIQAEVDTLVSRDGSAPNFFTANVDMNGYRIINLPAPVSATEPARHGDIQQYVDAAAASAAAALVSENAAELAETGAEAAQAASEAVLEDFNAKYLGAAASDPLVDLNGDALQNGAFYFNTTTDSWRAFSQDTVFAGADEVLAGADSVQISRWIAIPMTTLSSMSDVNAPAIANSVILRWSTGSDNWEPIALSAANTVYDDTSTDLDSVTVQAALEELVSRTSLGVYDISFWVEGLMEDDEALFKIVAARQFTIKTDSATVAKASVAANAETTVTLTKNDVQFGTIVWSAAGTDGTVTIPGDTVFNTGDILGVDAPSSADTALASIAFTLHATR